MKKKQGPKVLLLDIEISPIIAHVWQLFDNTVGLNQIEKDWHLLSFSAKFLNEKKVIYFDQRNEKNIEDDSKILKKIWKLLDDADIVIGQNSKKFDIKKLNSRFILNGLQPPSPYKQIDTLVLAKKHFAFTSNKLEYLSGKLCTKYKKLTNRKFAGHQLWVECLKGNKKAWQEMEKYNRLDVLSLEELYKKLIPWDGNSIDFNQYHDRLDNICKCGSREFMDNGYAYYSSGKFKRFKCKHCGANTTSKINEMSKEKKASLRASK